MASVWDKFVGTTTTTEGGEWPLYDADIYDGEILSVSEPADRPNIYKEGETQTSFYVQWMLRDQEDGSEVGELRQFINFPQAYLDGNGLNEKSNLYALMDGLGLIDDPEEIEVNPPSWPGMKARVTVEQYLSQKGEKRNKVSKVMPPRKRRSEAVATAKNAGRPLAKRLEVAEEDDE